MPDSLVGVVALALDVSPFVCLLLLLLLLVVVVDRLLFLRDNRFHDMRLGRRRCRLPPSGFWSCRAGATRYGERDLIGDSGVGVVVEGGGSSTGKDDDPSELNDNGSSSSKVPDCLRVGLTIRIFFTSMASWQPRSLASSLAVLLAIK